MHATDDERTLILEELDGRTVDAWSRYSDRLRDLAGREYDAAESDSWATLQAELRDIESVRCELLALAPS